MANYCEYGTDGKFSIGSVKCMNGKEYQCIEENGDASWVKTGGDCVSSTMRQEEKFSQGDIEVILAPCEHVTSKGEKFEICVKKKHLSKEHNYWFYIIEAKHITSVSYESWGQKNFSVYVKKESGLSEEDADTLAQNTAVNDAKNRLEEADANGGMPLYCPDITFRNGYAIT